MTTAVECTKTTVTRPDARRVDTPVLKSTLPKGSTDSDVLYGRLDSLRANIGALGQRLRTFDVAKIGPGEERDCFAVEARLLLEDIASVLVEMKEAPSEDTRRALRTYLSQREGE